MTNPTDQTNQTYQEGYLDGLTRSLAEIARIRGEFDHAIRVSEQTARVIQEDLQKSMKTNKKEDTINTYQDGYLDGLTRSLAEIARIRGEFDHALRIIEQTTRVMQEDRARGEIHPEAAAAQMDRLMQ